MMVSIRRVRDGKITFQKTSKFSIITINRPVARNAITTTMWNELDRIARSISANPKSKVVILRGVSGEFTAGSDIKEFLDMTPEEVNEAFHTMERAISSFEQIPVPVLCSIDGPAMGAGLVLSLACDIRIGTTRTRMGLPVGRLGIRLNSSFVRRISRLIGPSRTKELVYTNKIFEANTAKELGLLNEVVDSTELDNIVLHHAHLMTKQSRSSLMAVKTSVEAAYDSIYREQVWDFIDPIDFHEGCSAFLEKRLPRFN